MFLSSRVPVMGRVGTFCRAAEAQPQPFLNILKTSGWISYGPVSYKRAHAVFSQ